MDTIDAPIEVTPVQEPPKAESQPGKLPIDAMGNAPQPMDDAAVRAAISKAEAEGLNPETLSLQDLSQGQNAQPQPEAPRPDVPEKFRKPDGTVDVEKLQTSNRQLTEALQKKESEVTKTIDDYLKEYEANEKKFRELPNPNKLAANLRQEQPVPAAPAVMTDDQLRNILMRDFQADPLATTAQLIDIAIQKRLEPIEADKRKNTVRENIAELASKDPRITKPEVFQAITAKLAQSPELWNLKNPHKAAWLEVKDELRLGEYAPQAAQAQPSRPASPILGGGTPPSVPSSSAPSPKDIVANLGKLDPRDKKQEAMGDAALRALLQGR